MTEECRARAEAIPPARLARVLPGHWRVVATDFAFWTDARTTAHEIEYTMRSTAPLRFDEFVSFTLNGAPVRARASVRVRRGGCLWRGSGRYLFMSSRWRVTGADGAAIAICFEGSALAPAGVEVLVRVGSAAPGLRKRLYASPRLLGLASDDIPGLQWLETDSELQHR